MSDDQPWRDGIYADPLNRDLGAAICGMIAGISLLKKHGIDPVETCRFLADDDSVEELIGRRLYERTPQ